MPCWKGYEMIGTKEGKGGSQVPNCVPKSSDNAEPQIPEGWRVDPRKAHKEGQHDSQDEEEVG